MNNEQTGGPAFPHCFTEESVGDCSGMTLRDYFAAHAPVPVMDMELADHCEYRYRYADAMLEARKPKPSADFWLPHNGGECPLVDGTIIDVRHRDKKETRAVPANEDMGGLSRDAGPEFWKHEGDDYDIVAYRIHRGQP